MHDADQPRGATSERRHRAIDQTSAVAALALQRRPVSAEPSWIIGGGSWLGSAILMGFTLHAQSIHPYRLDPPEDSDAQAENAKRPAAVRAAAVGNPLLLPGCPPREVGIRGCRADAPTHSPTDERRRF